MALVLSVASLKGGCGKSTITLNIAACLHRGGHRTIVLDCDPQGTSRLWAARAAENGREGPPVVALDARSLRRDLASVAAGFDVAVVDCPPRMGSETRSAMVASDLVVMPALPGAPDLWALRDTVAVFHEARELRPELAGVVLLNRAERTTLTRNAHAALDDLGVPVLDAVLRGRVAFGEATVAGAGVVDYDPHGEAAFEVRRVVRELLVTLGAKEAA